MPSTTMTTENYFAQDLPAAGIGRRLLALVYDIFLLFAIWMVTLLLWGHLIPPPENADGTIAKGLAYTLFALWIVETWAFYAWFWLHGGQTLGMRAWKLLSRDYRRRPMSLWQTVVRFLGGLFSWALLGAGYLIALMPPHQTLHDRLSATETVVVPKAR